MDLRGKVGQRLVFGFPGTSVPADFAAMVREYKIGNVILFRYNIESMEQLARLCGEIQTLVRGATGHPAFITIDQEGAMLPGTFTASHGRRVTMPPSWSMVIKAGCPVAPRTSV